MIESFNTIPAAIFVVVGMILGALLHRWRVAKRYGVIVEKALAIHTQIDELLKRERDSNQGDSK